MEKNFCPTCGAVRRRPEHGVAPDRDAQDALLVWNTLAAAEVFQLARDKEKKVVNFNYDQAKAAVLEENPELAEAYRELTQKPTRETEFAEVGEKAGAQYWNPSETLAQLASIKMVEMNLTYGQAAEYVLKFHPGLAKAFREFTLNLNSEVK